MQIQTLANLKDHHTFKINQTCSYLAIINSIDELTTLLKHPSYIHLQKLFIGQGSNMLFTEHFAGLVIKNKLMGKTITHSRNNNLDQFYHLHVASGENWHELVTWCVEQNIGGLENLALIPGCVGSAPVQNIGAYGVEFKDLCEYVDVLDLINFTTKRLTNAQCRFGYRDSIFKNQYYGQYFIYAVGLKVSKNWQPINQYGALKDLPTQNLSPQIIYQAVCKIRKEKLPDPQEVGNAGSFFKNPIISYEHYQKLIAKYPDLVSYLADSQIKVAAGWLIEKTGLKGFRFNNAQIHPKHALVLTNVDDCSAQDIIVLASLVTEVVKQIFGIHLEHEVCFIGHNAPTNLTTIKLSSDPLKILNEDKLTTLYNGHIDYIPVITSTNQYLLDLSYKLASGSLCLSEYQINGRGRRGNQWHSPFGVNIYMSLLFKMQSTINNVASCSLIIGIATIDVLADIGISDLKLKWPNDIYYKDQKLAGILIETSSKQNNNHTTLVIGMGMNVYNHNNEIAIDQPWTNLETIITKQTFNSSIKLKCEELVSKFANFWQKNLVLYEKHGLQHFLKRWQELDYFYAQEVQLLINGQKNITGTAIGIDDQGQIKIKQADGIKSYPIGELSLKKFANCK